MTAKWALFLVVGCCSIYYTLVTLALALALALVAALASLAPVSCVHLCL